MNCKKCGNEVTENMTACPMCGEPIVTETTTETAAKTSATSLDEARKQRTKSKAISTVIGIVLAVIIAVVKALTGGGGDIEKTPNKLDYSTYVYDDGTGVVNTKVYGYKDDIVYTYSDIYTYDLAGWAEDEIQELVAYFDSFATQAQGLDCYEYIKDVTETSARFEDVYQDLGYSESIEAFESIGWFEEDDEDYFISISMTEESLLAEGYVKQ